MKINRILWVFFICLLGTSAYSQQDKEQLLRENFWGYWMYDHSEELNFYDQWVDKYLDGGDFDVNSLYKKVERDSFETEEEYNAAFKQNLFDNATIEAENQDKINPDLQGELNKLCGSCMYYFMPKEEKSGIFILLKLVSKYQQASIANGISYAWSVNSDGVMKVTFSDEEQEIEYLINSIGDEELVLYNPFLNQRHYFRRYDINGN